MSTPMPVLDDDVVAVPLARPQLARRVQRVIARLIAEHRWPDVATLPGLLPRLAREVLTEHPLTRPSRAAGMKVTAAAATYCWEFLPAPAAAWVPGAVTAPVDAPPALVWQLPGGDVVVDVLLTGLQRDPLKAAALSIEALLTSAPAPAAAVRVLPLAAPAAAVAVLAGGDVVALAASPVLVEGGLWR